MHKSELSCLFAFRVQNQKLGFGLDHSHACTELIWYEKGRGVLHQDRQSLAYQAGDVAIYQPSQSHQDECIDPGVQYCLGLKGGEAEKLSPGLMRVSEEFQVIFKHLPWLLARNDHQKMDRINQWLPYLLYELTSFQTHAQSRESPPWPDIVEKAKSTLDHHFQEELSMGELAQDLGISSDYLRQLFVKWLDQSPQQYLLNKRFSAACDLLRLNQHRTSEIAKMVGIEQSHYFSRWFKQRSGETPSQYRQRHAHVV